MRTAVIGIGSNSVRMLLAEVNGGHGLRLYRGRAVTRLFAGLGEDRCLSPEAMDKTVRQVALMAEEARKAGAEEVLAFATSATRDAANRETLRSLVREAAGISLRVCSGEEEALHSYLGAGEGRNCGVIDIGGGSTEMISGDGERLLASFSSQMGAVRMFREYPIDSRADVPGAIDRAQAVIGEALVRCSGWVRPETWWGTGGAFTSIGSLLNRMHWQDRTRLHGTPVTPEAAMAQALDLADIPLEERVRLPWLQPGRADIVVHGICIMLACMRLMDIREMRVSEYGNLEGFLKEHYHLARLDTLPTA